MCTHPSPNKIAKRKQIEEILVYTKPKPVNDSGSNEVEVEEEEMVEVILYNCFLILINICCLCLPYFVETTTDETTNDRVTTIAEDDGDG